MRPRKQAARQAKGNAPDNRSRELALVSHVRHLHSVVDSLSQAAPQSMSGPVRHELALAEASAREYALAADSQVKYFDLSVTASMVTAGSLYNICFPTQGLGDFQRIGDFVNPQKVHARVYMSHTSNAVVRWALVRSFAGLVPAADVLEGDGTAYAPLSFEDWDKRSTFEILKTGNVVLNAYKTNATVEICHDCDQFPIRFEAGSTTTNSGALSLIFWSDAASAGPSLVFSSRVEFLDA